MNSNENLISYRWQTKHIMFKKILFAYFTASEQLFSSVATKPQALNN